MNTIKCEICGREFSDLRGIANHISRTHKVSKQEYYNKFLKKTPTEGTCKVCGKITRFNGLNGYTTHCSLKCAQKDSDVREKAKQTNIKIYGVDNPWKADCVKEKIKDTWVSKYGVDNPNKSEEIKAKTKQTKLDRYGDENYNNSEKNKETCRSRYGVDHPLQLKEIRDKINKTNIEKYGAEWFFQTPMFNDKVKQTSLDKYGVDSPNKSDIVKNHKKQTFQNKYGVDTYLQTPEIKNKVEKICYEKYGTTCALGYLGNHTGDPWSEEARSKRVQTNLDVYGVDNPWKSEEIRKKCMESKKKNGSYGISKPEERTFEKLVEIFGNVEREHKEDRYPYFCDFYIPERDMFIEYNGFWTHDTHWYDENSEEDINKIKLWESKDSNYHRVAIDNWTVSDIKKRNTARENNLNYVVFWNENDVDKWIADGCPDRQDWR